MSSQWVNKFAIMRDLSLAQGCLPVDVAGTVGAGEKPPSTLLKEDTEEDFYRQWVGGDGDFAAPDLGLIKDMLEMVRNHDSPTNENEDSGNIIQIRKLNPHCAEFIPKAVNSNDVPVTKMKKLKKKKPRNAAVESLLQNMEEAITTDNKQSFKLLKPADFSPKPTVEPETAEKVSGWIQTQPVKKTPSPTKKNVPMLDINPMLMFKKKNTTETIKTKPVQEVKKTSPYNFNKYVPSKNAEEYYKKFVECSEMHRIVEEDVWTKVERQMKEIDDRRKAEAELFSLSLALCEEQPTSTAAATHHQEEQDPMLQKLDLVLLPQHRHQMSSPCIVCAYQSSRPCIVCEVQTAPDNQPQTTSDATDKPDQDDPWWNWREPEPTGKPVHNNWRKKSDVNQTENENIDTVKEPLSWRADNNKVLESFKSQKKTLIPKDENKTESITTAENENLETLKELNTNAEDNISLKELNTNAEDNISLKELNTDAEDNISLKELNTNAEDNISLKEHKTNANDNSWKEEFETWRSPLDDEDEIDAWRYEILGVDDDDDDDDETVDKTETVNNKQQHTEDEPSWQNDEHIEEVINNLRSLLLENDTINTADDDPVKSAFQTQMFKLKDKKKLFDCPLETMEILSDSE